MGLIAWVIVACEILFWVVIIAGLTMRYLFKRKKIGLLIAISHFVWPKRARI